MLSSRIAAVALLACLAGCGDNAATVQDLRSTVVTLPNGSVIRAERVTEAEDLARGMMFRDSLPAGRGMLFIYGKESNYSFWMFNVKIPLDIVWMDHNRKIVQMVYECPPCPGPAEKCPSYGGDFPAQYILEMKGGEARKQGLRPGMILKF